VDPVALRRRIRVVFQDAHAYDLTARENIAIGDLDALADPVRIAAAAGRAGIHDAVAALPRGYDTMLSRMFTADDDSGSGVGLSGGQWQRLAIARGTVLDGADLLVLDEPSSALDAGAEAEVHARLRDLRRGRTTLLISHRLGVVREADHIVVLSGGAVTERGTHDELVARGGAYARLFEIQAAGYRVP
jgi:ATP-binding cassette subfamily B protein